MRVLVVHNRYSSRVPSGENLAVDDEVRWLRDAGVDVHTHEVSNDDLVNASPLQRIRQAASVIWSTPAQRRMAEVIERVEPDLVHIHNLFPLLSASVPWTALRRQLPVVWTVHNRRVVCVIGTNFRDGKPCHECRPGWRLPGVRHGCYGESVGASALATGATSMFRSIARRRVTPIAISHHVKSWLVETAGFPADQVAVKHNGVAPPPTTGGVPPDAAACHTLLFAGHLSDHKGVDLLLDAWRRADCPGSELRVVGDGPRAVDVRHAAAEDGRITWVPHVPTDEMPVHLADARVVVVPSTWEEPFGRTAAEALAYGRPVVTTGTGGLREVVDETSGWVTGTDPANLGDALREATTSDAAVTRRAAAATERYRSLFSPAATTRSLLRIYEATLAYRSGYNDA